MKTNEKIKKNKILKIIILLIAVATIIALAGLAYARYVTSISGQTEAQIAKWSFKVVDGDASTINVLDFPITRTDNNTEVDSSTIAPGTYGVFEIDVDARGTETILNYGISIGFTNKPQNLKFYADENMTNEISLDSNGRLVLSRFLSLDDVKNIQSNIIYWNWPLETGTTQAEIDYNDGLDSQFVGKTLTMAITVTGTQAIGNGITVTYDKNYFEDDLLNKSDIGSIYVWSGNACERNVTSEKYGNAKDGKYAEITVLNPSETYRYGIGPFFRTNSILGELEIGKKYTICMYVKSTHENLYLKVGHEQQPSLTPVVLHTTWERVTWSFEAVKSQTGNNLVFYNHNKEWQDGDKLYIHSLELMEGEPTYYTTTIEKNANLGNTITPKRAGYEFLGWYTDPVAGERVTSNTTITQDTTLYANWRFIE